MNQVLGRNGSHARSLAFSLTSALRAARLALACATLRAAQPAHAADGLLSFESK